jgi:outer membrane immunogenic protein
MEKVLTGAAVLIALIATPVLAADLTPPYYKTPAVSAPAVSWTGCYVNGGVGYGMWKQEHFAESYPGLVQLDQTTDNGGEGWLGRLGLGCDYQVGASVIVGAFGDYDFMNIHGTVDDPLSGLIGEDKESGAWGAGGRLGYLVSPSVLAYFNGGYTETRFDQLTLTTGFPPVPAPFSVSAHTYHGWFVGGGAEYALGFMPVAGLFWRTEYRYASYQSADLPLVSTAIGTTVGAQHSQKDVQTITSGLVWRFNFGEAITTRY